ncbi:hypothetical protein [Sphingobium sp. SA916]|uniref:hypothetical protein n=1 Tax=Sphingobium sp. SA916 TaxID=1851207 RepID=UPI0011AEFC61|nr:hypothetical protein [Sphingobium sp. SA916]
MARPEREIGWDDALIDRARSLFLDTARRFNLQYDWDETSPVGAACIYPVQSGLDFDLWLSLDADEFVCSGDQWYASLSPADDENRWELIVQLVEGLITGDARLVLYKAIGWSKPYWTEVQLQIDGRWKSVSTGAGCAIPPVVRPTIIRNGHQPTVGMFRPALGSLLMLIAIIGMVYWISK